MSENIKHAIGQTRVSRAVMNEYIKACSELSSGRKIAGSKKFTQAEWLSKTIEKFTKNPNEFLKYINYDGE